MAAAFRILPLSVIAGWLMNLIRHVEFSWLMELARAPVMFLSIGRWSNPGAEARKLAKWSDYLGIRERCAANNEVGLGNAVSQSTI